jgi:phosphatidylserine/phosphatidylglycerophosphate/cardiolipin synthase-like enzyme
MFFKLSWPVLSTLLMSCATSVGTQPESRVPASKGPAILMLPSLHSKNLGKGLGQQSQLEPLRDGIEKYLQFLGIEPNSPDGEEIVDRIAISSAQFLVCEDFEDWDCLEEPSSIKPTKPFRVDSLPNLGKKVSLKRDLKLEYFFTEQWNIKNKQRDLSKSLAQTLARKISEPWQALSFAMYGIDDKDLSMKSVYDGILSAQKSGVDVRGVFDTEGLYSKVPRPIVFTNLPNISNLTYKGRSIPNVLELNPDAKDRNGKPEVGDFMNFYYKETGSLLKTLNSNAKSEIQTLARMEWPPEGAIMHNKFFVFEGKKGNAVWTGTANISRTCMGDESNANMSIYIEDDDIASVFKTEFQEMYSFQKAPFVRSGFVGLDDNDRPSAQIRAGAFKENKRPNTKRYFEYADGTELRIHFSPTDDGEHRAILPMIYSARPGDQLRVSMFGSSGIQFVRALQYAAAKGVDVKVLIDSNSGLTAKGSWIHKDSPVKLQDENPYEDASGSLEVRVSGWSGGMNHHKTASLTRMVANKQIAEVLIVGSQNWSIPGNDVNDENMVTLRNKKFGLQAAAAFNDHFDNRLWVNARVPKPPVSTSQSE